MRGLTGQDFTKKLQKYTANQETKTKPYTYLRKPMPFPVKVYQAHNLTPFNLKQHAMASPAQPPTPQPYLPPAQADRPPQPMYPPAGFQYPAAQYNQQTPQSLLNPHVQNPYYPYMYPVGPPPQAYYP